jgi:hypothetical protein
MSTFLDLGNSWKALHLLSCQSCLDVATTFVEEHIHTSVVGLDKELEAHLLVDCHCILELIDQSGMPVD